MPPINKALFDTMSTQFAILSNDERSILKQKKKEFKKELKHLLATNEFLFTSITSATGDKKRANYRHRTIQQLIQDTLNKEL